MTKSPRLNAKSRKEQVYEYLREQMRTGGLRPGSVIDMEEILSRMGLSMTPLRDALLRLESEGFVSILPRRKIVVNPLGLRDIKEFYEILGALESTALAASFNRLGATDLNHMETLNAEMKKAVDEGDFSRYYLKNRAFHDVFINLSGNACLIKTIYAVKERLYDFPRRLGFVKEWELDSIDEHAELIALISRGQLHEAVDHIRNVLWSFAVQEKFIARYYPLSASFD